MWSRNGVVETMAMPQREDDTIEAIKRLDALLEYAVMHGDETEAERIREERTGGCVGFAEGRRSRGDRPTGGTSEGDRPHGRVGR